MEHEPTSPTRVPTTAGTGPPRAAREVVRGFLRDLRIMREGSLVRIRPRPREPLPRDVTEDHLTIHVDEETKQFLDAQTAPELETPPPTTEEETQEKKTKRGKRNGNKKRKRAGKPRNGGNWAGLVRLPKYKRPTKVRITKTEHTGE